MPPDRAKLTRTDTIPEDFDSLEAFWGFWDAHSSADYEDLMEPVEVKAELASRRAYCAIARDLWPQVRTRARQQGISTETLVNLWLRDKLAEAT